MAHYLLQFFAYDHLRPELQSVAQAFANLAGTIDTHLPDNPERTTALRKLLEAKDCAVRAVLYVAPLPAELPAAEIPPPSAPTTSQ